MASVLGVALPDGIEWGVCVRDAGTGDVLAAAGADSVLPAASMGKLLLLVEVARSLDPSEPLTRTPEDAVADSGLWQHLAVDTLPAGDLAALVGAVSDNLATNVLLRRVGLDGVRETARGLGLRDTALHDRVRDERTAEHPPALSTATAGELSALFAALAAGRDAAGAAGSRGPLTPAVRERVLGWLALGTDHSMVASAFGLDPLARDHGLRLRHKTGTDVGVRAEAGLLDGPERASPTPCSPASTTSAATRCSGSCARSGARSALRAARRCRRCRRARTRAGHRFAPRRRPRPR